MSTRITTHEMTPAPPIDLGNTVWLHKGRRVNMLRLPNDNGDIARVEYIDDGEHADVSVCELHPADAL